MSVEPGLLDANILVYAVEADAPRHAISRALIEAARDPAAKAFGTTSTASSPTWNSRLPATILAP